MNSLNIDANYLNELHTDLLDCSRGRLNKQDMIFRLQTFSKSIKNQLTGSSTKNEFITNHNDKLSAIKFELEYLIKEPHMKPNTDLILLRDRIYADLLRDVQIVHETRAVTNIFNEFMKGITFFSGQMPNSGQPIYHRSNSSCPSRGKQNDSCNSTNVSSGSNVSKSKNKKIRTCYIERLVYDALWAKLMFSLQDIGHIEWLGKTKQAYQTCFPGQDIFVEVELDDTAKIPIVLKLYDNDNIEVYEKTYDYVAKGYVDKVLCFLYDTNFNMKRKETNFDQFEDWK